MRENRQLVFEETDKEKNFLSVKAPLSINNKIEGIIGLAVDITDRKKREEAENKLKMQEELYNIAKYVSHDIAQPVTVLKGYLDLNKSLSGEEKRIFDEVARSIENIADRLLSKYRGGKDAIESHYVLVTWCLERMISQKREQYKGRDIEFKSSLDSANKFVFIRGNFVDFSE